MTVKAVPAIQLRAKPATLKLRAPQSALARFDKNLRNAAKQPQGEIDILGEIGDPMWGGIDAGAVKEALRACGTGPVLVSLNSPGGDAFEGIAIYNVLREHPGQITVKVLGLAASAASVVAMAGDKIIMGRAAMMMIHSAWGIAIGNQQELRDFANVLDALDQSVAGLYAHRTGMKVDDVLELMHSETWMSADQAIDDGFADSIADDEGGASARARGAVQITASAGQRPPAATGDQRRPGVQMSAAQRPGASGNSNHPLQGASMKTIAEQIAANEAKRAANIARMDAIMAAAGEAGTTLDAAGQQEWDTLNGEVETIDGHLVRLKTQQQRQISQAARVGTGAGESADAAAAARAAAANNGGGGARVPVIFQTPNIEKGVRMARFAMSLFRGKGNLNDALSIYQNERRWMDQTPEIAKVLMAAVAAGDTTTSGWASELVYNENLAGEFIEFLRPMTIMGKMNLRRVPFNVRMGQQNGQATGYWVGQGAPIPVSKPGVTSQSLGIAKCAGLVAIDEELARSSSPSAEILVRDDLAKTISTFMDVQFVDPNVAAVANINPASITNGVTAVVPTGTTAATLRTDLATLMKAWLQADLDISQGVFIMTPNQAMNISLMLNSLGVPLFPDIGPMGGKLLGLPVITSNSANIPGSPDSGNMIILACQSEIFLADDGQVTIDVSREASIQMLDNPTNASTGATVATTSVSMFQTHSLALRAVRFVNWAKRRTTAVAYIKEAAYVA